MSHNEMYTLQKGHTVNVHETLSFKRVSTKLGVIHDFKISKQKKISVHDNTTRCNVHIATKEMNEYIQALLR